jgi:hypothetical protein
MDMEKNIKNAFDIFDDKNMNKYCLKIDTLSICDKLYKTMCFKDHIMGIGGFTSMMKFSRDILRNECTFTEIVPKILGLVMVKELYNIAQMHTLDDNNDTDDNDDTDNIDDDDVDIVSDTEDKTTYDVIETNIPILLTACKKLKKNIEKTKTQLDKVRYVLQHYKYCKDCDITNNNKYELCLTLGNISIESIEFTDDGSYNILKSFMSLEKIVLCDRKEEYIKLYYVQDDDEYKDDILIEYTTLVHDPNKT